MGGSSEAAARRAARLQLPFFPALGDERLVEWYRDEAAKVGFEQPFCLLPHGPGFVHVTDERLLASVSVGETDQDTFLVASEEGVRTVYVEGDAPKGNGDRLN